MMHRAWLLFFFAAVTMAAQSSAGVPADVAAAVSAERIAAIMKKLGSFATRNTNQPGAAEAARWIRAEMQSYSPRLEVRFDAYRVKKKTRIVADVDLINVVAVLRGRKYPDRHLIVSGHYDSLTIVPKKPEPGAAPDTEPGLDNELSAAAPHAPGVSDDASGVAAVMELARVMSQYEFDKTLVFIAFAGEEQGLVGSTLYSSRARKQNQMIEAVLNNDIIGNDTAGNGVTITHAVRVFSGDPADSPSRSLARYVHAAAARWIPSMRVDLIFRDDRFARGGDHTPFHEDGFAAVRLTTPAEALELQHSPKDNFKASSPAYTARVARVNGVALASLGLAPPPPDVIRMVPSREPGKPPTPGPNLSRGKSRYDAVLRWKTAPEAVPVSHRIVVRSTLSPFWEREIQAGEGNELRIENFSIDDVVIGVKAVGTNGFESLVSAYIMTPYKRQQWEATEIPNR